MIKEELGDLAKFAEQKDMEPVKMPALGHSPVLAFQHPGEGSASCYG